MENESSQEENREKEENDADEQEEEEESEGDVWYTGVCKWFHPSKGWGFVIILQDGEEGSPDGIRTTEESLPGQSKSLSDRNTETSTSQEMEATIEQMSRTTLANADRVRAVASSDHDDMSGTVASADIVIAVASSDHDDMSGTVASDDNSGSSRLLVNSLNSSIADGESNADAELGAGGEVLLASGGELLASGGEQSDDSEAPRGDIFVHQSAIVGNGGWRYLLQDQRVKFTCKKTDRGWEASRLHTIDHDSNPGGGGGGRGSRGRGRGGRRGGGGDPNNRRVRCFNCGEVSRHLAAECPRPVMPKRCHFCKSQAHLIGNCPVLPPEKRVRPEPRPRGRRGGEERQQ